MKIRKILAIAIALFIILTNSCETNSSNNISGEFIKISLDVNNSTDFLLSDFIENVSYVPLETNEQSVISTINKMYVFKNKLYLLDKQQNALFVFSENGEFLQKFKKQGKGPGEYIEITDFSIDTKNGAILILDNINKSYNLYTSDFSFIKTIKTDNTIFFCELMNDKIIGYSDNFSHFEKYNLHVYDIGNQEKRDYLPINEDLKDFQSHNGGQFMLNINNEILFKESLSYKIYKIDSEGLKKHYYIDFGEFSMPNNYFSSNLDFNESVYNLNDGTYAVYPTIFFENANIIYFRYQFKNYKHVIYNKKTNKLIHGNVKDDINNLFFVTPTYTDGVAYYSIIEPINFLNYFKYLESDTTSESSNIWQNIIGNKSNEILLNLKFGGNPIIIKYKLK